MHATFVMMPRTSRGSGSGVCGVLSGDENANIVGLDTSHSLRQTLEDTRDLLYISFVLEACPFILKKTLCTLSSILNSLSCGVSEYGGHHC